VKYNEPESKKVHTLLGTGKEMSVERA